MQGGVMQRCESATACPAAALPWALDDGSVSSPGYLTWHGAGVQCSGGSAGMQTAPVRSHRLGGSQVSQAHAASHSC